MKSDLIKISILGWMLVFIGCVQTESDHAFIELPERISYSPGLGGMMMTMQAYHTKLFYAGSEQNWELATYFVHELEETLEDIKTYHGEHKGMDISGLVEGMADPAIKNIEQAIASGKSSEFEPAFDRLTNTCNGCHGATGYSFIRIQTPVIGDFVDQDFRAAHFNH